MTSRTVQRELISHSYLIQHRWE